MPGTARQPPARPTDVAPLHDRLSGGDPRTLHNVEEVVKTVLADPDRLGELVLASDDQIVRLRAGDALEKVCRTRPGLMQPHVWLLLGEMATIHQASVRWHHLSVRLRTAPPVDEPALVPLSGRRTVE
jgi:hypothetical protein